MVRWVCILICTVCIAITALPAFSQNVYRVQHQPPTLLSSGQKVNLDFEVPGLSPGQVQEATLFYRYDGAISYRQKNVAFGDAGYSADLSVEQDDGSSLEYYFQIQLTDGRQLFYPTNFETAGEPVTVNIVDEENGEVEISDRVEGIEYTILSPEPGSKIIPADLMIALALFYDEGTVDTTDSRFKLLFNGEDITVESAADDYFFSYVPEDIIPGEHTVTLQLVSTRETLEIVSWRFTVTDSDTGVQPGEVTVTAPNFIPSGSAELVARNQVIAGDNNDALRGEFRASGQRNSIRYNAYGLLTSQQTSRLQPQNRFGIELLVDDWLELNAGHVYPVISPLTISGRRILGVHTDLRAWDDRIQFQFMFGQVRRSITNIYDTVDPRLITFDDIAVDTSYTLTFRDGGVGTFKRNITGGRLSVGHENRIQWGLNLLKVQDDTNSIDLIRDFNDLQEQQPELAGGLSEQEMRDLTENPNQLNIAGNPVPKGNLVAGTDFKLNLFDNRIRLKTETAASLLNNDISGGPLTSDNDLGIDVDNDLESFLDKISWLIIINENMSTFPFRFDVTAGDNELDPFFPAGIIASETELTANYYGNNLRLRYRWVGPDYRSLANATVRNDIAGITLTDRFRLLENQLYITLGYEDLRDNLTGVKDATTDTRTIRTNFSWLPAGMDRWRANLGLMYRNRDNGVTRKNPFLSSELENRAVQNFIFQEGDTVLTANPRLTNTFQVTTSISRSFELFDITHDASLNYSLLKTNDDFFRFGDTDNNTVSLNITSRLNFVPLDTRIGININNTATLGGLSESDIFGFNLGGRVLLMDDRLSIDGDLAFTRNVFNNVNLEVNDNGTPDLVNDDFFEPSVDEQGNRQQQESKTNLFIIRTAARYTINSNNAVLFNLSFTNVANKLGSINSSNDRIIEIRYRYKF